MKHRAQCGRNRLRWIVVAAVCVSLVVIGEFCVNETSRVPQLGIRLERQGGDLAVAWVQPVSLTWDAGIRPGHIVIGLDGEPVVDDRGPQDLAAAQAIQVRTSEGRNLSASVASARQIAEQRLLSFGIIAVEWVLVGGVVFLLAADVFAASILLLLSVSGAAALLVAVATPFGNAWALLAEVEAYTIASAVVVLLFLVFPVNRLNTAWGRYVAWGCGTITGLLLALNGWFILVDATGGDAFGFLHRGIVAVDFLGATILAIAASVENSPSQREARRALGLVAMGALAGLMPFGLLSMAPQAVGLGYLVHPDIAILSVAFLPASLGAAI
ncbi:MAG: hypothetical protein ACUVX1_15290, partial [Chloroflexota bacterium]